MRPGPLALVLLALAAPSAALGQTRDDDDLLWATVNVCDTAAYADTIGIRASMPGTGSRRDEMFMRFGVQYLDESTGRWHNLTKSGDSGFVGVGSGRFRARQAGHLFRFAPPQGNRYRLRGVVRFEWRRDGAVTRSVRLLTTAGRRSTAGADPPDYSAAVCVVG